MDDYLPWFILLRAPSIGPVQQYRLLKEYSTPENLLKLTDAELEKAGLKKETIRFLKYPDTNGLDRDIAWLNQPDHYLLTIFDDLYPDLLKEIPDPPVALFVDGNPAVLSTIQLGIVGSRNPTHGGRDTAHIFAKQLVEQGITITSGLALGIDYCAHSGALEAGGHTIAVLGNGIDRIYPVRHKKISDNIKINGAIISEFPTGVPPLPEHFPRRNRMISGMSLGVLVVEAAQRSGSLITAKYAVEQGRDVFAVPGSIRNLLARGCHSLIKEGAILVETLDDILVELNFPFQPSGNNVSGKMTGGSGKYEFDENYRQLIDCISYDPVSIDKLIEITGLTADTVSSMLLVLEVKGIVSSSGGMYTRIN